jgi:hypothetical protein
VQQSDHETLFKNEIFLSLSVIFKSE